MKAVILAGGEGKRLRPVTCNTPKPLTLLCGKPMILYIIELLAANGIGSVIISLCCMGDEIMKYFDGDSYCGVSLSFISEDSPLGTAGAVRNAADDDDVLVISSDVMCDFDLAGAVRYFEKSGADAAIITKRVDDPREYGLVVSDDKGRVRSISEKPPYESCTTDSVNTGIYILSESAVKRIPYGEKTDFMADIFPKMLSGGMSIISIEEVGYWSDIDTIESYITCQRDMLEGRVRCSLDGHKTLDGIITSSLRDFRGARIVPPVYIGKNVSISDGAVIDAGSIICDNAVICRGAKVHGAVILTGAYIGERTTCNDAVICSGAKILSGAAVFENAAIGNGTVVEENAVVEAGVRIWSGKRVSRGGHAAYDVKYGGTEGLTQDEDGYCGETNGKITPSAAAVIGSSAAAISDMLVVGHNGTLSGEAISMAFVSGALSAGAEVMAIGRSISAEVDFATLLCNVAMGCFIEGGAVTKIRLFSKGGLPLTREQERIIEAGVMRSEYRRAGFSEFGCIRDISSVRELYLLKLKAMLGETSRVHAEVSSSDETVKELSRRLLCNTKGREKLIFNISSDGRKLSVYSDEAGYVFYEKLLLIGCLEEFRSGRDVVLPYSSPVTADILGKKYGSSVQRYYSCSADGRDRLAREKALKCQFPRDAFMLMISVIKCLDERKLTLSEAIAELPSFTAARRFVPTDRSPAKVLRSICEEQGGLGEGTVKTAEGARVLIRPVKTGKGVMMFVESFRNETAAEICDFYEKEIRDSGEPPLTISE